MIDEALQDEIRVAYQTLTEALKLNPRWGQRQMIAEVANALGDPESDPPIAVVEAGTGTGKTVAYLVAALPIARQRGKKWWLLRPRLRCRSSCYFAIYPM